MRDAYLIQYGLARNSTEETMFLARNQETFSSVTSPKSIHVSTVWTEAKRLGVTSGNLFEMIVGSVLFSLGLGPFYRHVALAQVPELDIDFVIFGQDPSAPICLQLTSTLRERHKLADLQAFKVKHYYPNAYFALLTMDSKDVARKLGMEFPSLDLLVDAGSEQFDDLIALICNLEKWTFVNSALSSTRSSTFHSLDFPYSGIIS